MTNHTERLEYLRTQLRAECISYGELVELQSLAEYIDPSDVELLEAAGVPEHDDEKRYVCPQCHSDARLVAAYHEHVEYPIGLIGQEDGEPVILELGDPEILGDVYSQSEGLYCNGCEKELSLDELVLAGGDGGPFDTERGKHAVGED